MSDCLFCKIIRGEVPSTKVYEDDFILGFRDINPVAKEHLLFIHKEHTVDITDMMSKDPSQLTALFIAATTWAKSSGLFEDGMRLTTNQGPNAGQSFFHTHFHLLGGEPLAYLGRLK